MDDAKKYLDAIAKRLSQLWEQHRRAIPQGLFTGSVCALAYLVIKPFYSLAVAWGTSKVPKQIAEGYRQPDQLFALALFIACTLLLASSGWLANFLRRSVNSLKFGIIVGWFPASAAGAFICWVVAPRVTSIVFAAAILMGLFSGQLLFAVLLIPKAPADVSIPDIPIDSFTKIDFDSPIRDWESDLIGRSEFVRAVISRILVDKPPVVAVTGGYGEGKSSILNLVEEVLARETQVIVVRFNSWVPGNEQSYAASFFSTISGQIQKRFFFPELRKPLMELARTVAGSIPKIPLKEFLAQASQTTEIQEMKSVFARLPVRVVVLVDEVDRMQPDELGTLLRVIRGIDQIENLTYVCALNLKAVTKIVEKWSVNPSEYLEKFFTAQLALPKVDSVLLENLFSESIDRIVTSLQIFETSGGRKQFDEDLSSVWSKTLKWQLTNLRKMGQFLRLFESTLGAVRREVNAHDLLVLQALQILVPEAYEFIYSRANLFYVTNWRIEKWSEAPHVDDSRAQVVRNEAFKEFFDSLDDTQRPLAEALMGEIFPVVEQYKAAGRFGLSMRSEGQASLERRIYHPDFFPRYFIHRAPLNLFSETELANFAKALRSATTASKQRAIEDMLSRVQQNPSRRWDFWDRLGKAVKGLDDESRIALARAAAKASKTFAQGFLGIGEYSAGRRLVFIAATDLDDKSRVQPLLDSVIKDATSDYFASDIVRFGSRTDDPSLAELVGFVDAQKLAEAFGARMSKLYYPGSSLGPDYKSGDAVHAFVRWSGTSDEAKQKVYAYFRSRFKFSPTDEELFILWSVPPDASFEGSIKAFFELLFPFPEFRDLTAPHRPNWSEAALRSFARLESDPGPSPSQESAQ